MSGRRRRGPADLGAQPLAGTDLVLVDGNNLLHRVAGGPGPAALERLLADVAAVLPSGVAAIVVLDGPAEPGRPARDVIGPGLETRHAAPADADTAILQLVHQRPSSARGSVLVVTDDRSLADRAAAAGALPRRLGWFVALLGRSDRRADPTHRPPPGLGARRP